MKLHDWIIFEALRAGDWFAAANGVASLFDLPSFTADAESIRGMTVHATGSGFQEIRIGLNGKLYMWQPGITRIRKTAVVGPWIVIWANRTHEA